MNLLQLTTDNWLGRLNAAYHLNEQGILRVNLFTAAYVRRGNDPVATRFYGQDYYSSPTTLSKTVVGLAYEHRALDEKLSSITSAKYYAYRSQGFSINNALFEEQKQAGQQYGFSQATRYRLGAGMLAKLSYEYATRLPDEFELFGDFMITRPNPGLVPETSHNVNAGLGYKSPKLSAELNGFYRLTDQIIYLQASQFYAQYRNLLKARVLGVEADVLYRPFAFLTLTVNATFQDIRNKSPKENAGVVDNRYYNARLPNIPYLFSHAGLQYQKRDWLKKGNHLQCWWNVDYVHWFYLYWAVDGLKELKNQIPSQLIQSAGLSYSVLQNRITISAEVHNLTDAKAYDNFSVQRPGRSFHLKLSTFLTKQPNASN
jgi:outer membrane receptor protein involved in Fe transport